MSMFTKGDLLDPQPEADSGGTISKHQAEWDRKMHMMDKQEKEVHQTQLKLIRDQTMVRDIGALRHEVGYAKAAIDSLKGAFEQDRVSTADAMSVLE
ncbi:unnamed protein product, partial [Polarella glacialis]